VSASGSSASAELVAQHFGARAAGTGRWIARCPVHPDKSPSLSIAAGRDGRVLVRCWVGCDLTAVLKSAGLSMGHLFPRGPAPTPEQRVGMERRSARERLAREEEGWTIDKARLLWQALERQRPVIARQLMCMADDAPGSAALTAYSHNILDAMRTIDSALSGEID
jgi:hypothetical protein